MLIAGPVVLIVASVVALAVYVFVFTYVAGLGAFCIDVVVVAVATAVLLVMAAVLGPAAVIVVVVDVTFAIACCYVFPYAFFAALVLYNSLGMVLKIISVMGNLAVSVGVICPIMASTVPLLP